MDDTPTNQINEHNQINERNQIEHNQIEPDQIISPSTLDFDVGRLLHDAPNLHIDLIDPNPINRYPVIEDFLHVNYKFHLDCVPLLDSDIIFGILHFHKIHPMFLLSILFFSYYGFFSQNLDFFKCMSKVHFKFFDKTGVDPNLLKNAEYWDFVKNSQHKVYYRQGETSIINNLRSHNGLACHEDKVTQFMQGPLKLINQRHVDDLLQKFRLERFDYYSHNENLRRCCELYVGWISDLAIMQNRYVY